MTTIDDNHITFIVPKHQLPAFIGSDGSITFMGRGSQNQKLARPGTWVRENNGVIEQADPEIHVTLGKTYTRPEFYIDPDDYN
jgi:hypothetical protein